jgi:RND family efflux transporter MFP subunit
MLLRNACCVVAGLMVAGAGDAQEFDCLIQPAQHVEIRSAVPGLIDRVHVDRGDFVKAGQVIATLESSAEVASSNLAKFRSEMIGPTRSAESRLQYSDQKLQRREQLAKEKFVSGQDLDEARSERRIAESEVLAAKENQQLAKLEHGHSAALLSLRSVKSPVSGVVTERYLNPGEVADLGEGRKPILKIAQLDPLRVEVYLPVQAYRSITAGMEAEIFPEAPIGGKYNARVKIVDRVVDAASATFGVRMELRNADHKLPAGIKCRAKFLKLSLPPPAVKPARP